MTFVPYRILSWSFPLISALLHPIVISSWTFSQIHLTYLVLDPIRTSISSLGKKHHLPWFYTRYLGIKMLLSPSNYPQTILKFSQVLKTIYLFIIFIAPSTALVQALLKTSALKLPSCPFLTTHHMPQRDLPKTKYDSVTSSVSLTPHHDITGLSGSNSLITAWVSSSVEDIPLLYAAIIQPKLFTGLKYGMVPFCLHLRSPPNFT